jgi:hypothetical protein
VNRQVYYQCCKHWSLCCLWTLGTATVTATSTTAGTTSTTGTTTTTTPAVCTGTRDLGEVSLNSYSAPNNVQCKFFLTVHSIYNRYNYTVTESFLTIYRTILYFTRLDLFVYFTTCQLCIVYFDGNVFIHLYNCCSPIWSQ